jgi:hypothetical protein
MASDDAASIVPTAVSGFAIAEHRSTGTTDYDDDRDDEQPYENEALVGATDEGTEIPEEFERDDTNDHPDERADDIARHPCHRDWPSLMHSRPQDDPHRRS